MIPAASTMPTQCHEVFALTHDLLLKLWAKHSSVCDMPSLVQQCGKLLKMHRSTEVGRLPSFISSSFPTILLSP
jgi:hypothetical protein